MEKFIEAVRAHPCLWNPQRTNDAWQIVVDEIKMESIPNIQKAKSEWKRLRDNHRDALKRAKLGKNKLLPAQVSTWKYAKAMQFLEPHMKYRITEDSELEAAAGAAGILFADFEVSTTDIPEQDEVDAKRRRLTLDATSSGKTRLDKAESDSLESFYDCVLKSTREMPQWMQIQVKKRIFDIIIDAEETINSHAQHHALHALHAPAARVKTEIKEELVDVSDGE